MFKYAWESIFVILPTDLIYQENNNIGYRNIPACWGMYSNQEAKGVEIISVKNSC